ncbi:MAG: sugar ABC transporter substrate-binding protein [Thermomicrobiales bacterium]
MKLDPRSAKLVDDFLRGRISRRQLVVRAAALGASVPVLTALNRPSLVSAQEDGFGNTPKAEQVDRLILWTRSTPDAPNNTEWQNLTNMANAYTEATGTPIEMVTVPDADFKQKMGTLAPAGEGPDVYGPIAHDWIGEFAIQGIAAEIPEELIEGRDDFIPVAFEAATVEGTLAALPLFVESVGLIYNIDMVPTPPATWEELVTMATELTAGDVYGFGFPLLEQYHEGAFYHGFGSYIFQYAEGEFDIDDIGLNNEGGVTAAKFLRDMFHMQQPPLPPVAVDRTNMHVQQEGMMEASQIAMTINGPWREAPLTAAEINYGVAKLPTLPGGDPMRPFLGVQCWAASSHSQNLEAALDFISFATGTNSVVEQFKGFVKAPVRQSALGSEEVQANANMAVWTEQAADGVPMPNIPEMSQVWTPWGDAIDAIIPPNASDEDVQRFLDGAAEQIAEKIEESRL